MKLITKVFGILIASVALVACDGGGSTPPKKVFKVVKEEITLGSPAGIPKIIINTYDDKGLLIRQDRDDDGNGKLEGFEEYYTYAYNEKGGLQIRKRHAPSGNVIIIEEYDEYGNRVSILNDTNRDGVFNYSDAYVNTYDDAGLLLKIESKRGVLSYTYDGDTVIESSDVAPADGVPNLITAKTYNEHGDLIKYQRDSNGDGVYDSSGIIYTYAYTFDNNNNIIKKEEDRHNDGVVTRVTVYTWKEFK